MKAPATLQAAFDEAHRARKALVERGELVSAEAMAKALKVTPRALAAATRRRRLFSVEFAGETLYPLFLADPGLSRRTLGAVCEALGDLSGWSKLNFFTTPKLSLKRETPLAALKHGQLKQVLTAAAGYSER